ncbi:ABC transporter ATP-binding protein [Aliidongia dinghuensis]|uniref:ABC transporter ATP-binding protein n=1 Tax=Aliidongia dinghuensis TaxID=1867774 RepID=A0A8J2Z0P7_9PROT|nr:ATP-binding cassette domain-containing protein [Aliidongia dinghuensis]GGF48010.1 ABC transporter ATP-binding protein [Aliidongia dinghuensis]
MTALLSLNGLSKRFGGLAAIQALDLELHEGIITALVGPNGAGKTTMFNLVTGNLMPDAGAVSLAGRPITGLAPHRVARLGIARSFQDLRLFTHMSVRDNVLASLERRAWFWQPGGGLERRAAAEAALERTGLLPLARARAIDLSYAEAKFLSLARIMASGAKIWLLDEPASGLDPASRSRFTALLRGAMAEGVTICLIEHNLDIVTEVADRIAFLDQGRKLAEGEPDEIMRNPDLRRIYFGERRQ